MLFQSMEQLASAFPPNYKLSILKTLNPYTGEYELVPADGAINFSSETGEQHNIVAFPVEKEHRVPLRGPVKRKWRQGEPKSNFSAYRFFIPRRRRYTADDYG